ncbi:TPA_asm: protein 3 [Apera virus 1]|uniref:Protein 3 n=1 Tax=Apera virus 1 TaxID=2977951 RepID=A0A9N6YJG6_9RHAB|nr:TPA_asm: protein 3 [Apera virus 1]
MMSARFSISNDLCKSNASIESDNGSSDGTSRFIVNKETFYKIPREKVSFSKRWTWTPKGIDGELNLGKISTADRFKSMKWMTGTLMDAEMHILYLPHLPKNIYKREIIKIKLHFKGIEEGKKSEMSVAAFPVSMHTHLIFYPGHSFSLKNPDGYPWKLTLETDAEIDENYSAADILIQITAYNSPVSQYSPKHGASIISLVPIEDVPTGVVLTKPRQGTQWALSKVKYGLQNKKDLSILNRMQEAHIDLEALQYMGILGTALNRVKKILISSDNDNKESTNNQIIHAVMSAYKLKTKF